MPFKVFRCSLNDLPTCSAIQWQASKANQLYQIHYPNGGVPALHDWTTYHMRWEHARADMSHVKVVDISVPDRILGYAKWTVEGGEFVSGRDAGQRAIGAEISNDVKTEKPTLCSPFRPPDVAMEDCISEPMEDWQPEVLRKRHHYLNGTPTIVLDDLWVAPEFQRQGAGTALVSHLVEFADNEKLPCYIESTPAAHGLHIRQGFEKVDEVKIDLAKWKEGYGVYKTAMLYRHPKTALGDRKRWEMETK